MKRGFCFLLTLLLALVAAAPAAALTPWTLEASYPHDETAFTQGLLWHDGALYESTGQVGASEIRKVRLRDGKVLRRVSVPPPYFGEGLALWKDRLISLSWQQGEGFVWSLDRFRKTGSFRYAGEGWGLTSDGTRLVLSDGTPALRFFDPETLKETGRITVTWNGQPLGMLNELEWVDGEILANVWMTALIARIDPDDGKVIDWIDLRDLVAQVGARDADNVLNGIAWDATTRRLFVTGKRWPTMFAIRMEKPNAAPAP